MQAVERTIRAADGWRLSVLDLTPEGPPRGLVIAGHAMMVDRRTLAREDRPCVAAELLAAGLRVLAPDLRGHGRSGPSAAMGGDWSYDQLVEDTEVLVAHARALAPELPIATLGHSLFGHTTLAHLARAPAAPIAAHVAIGSEVWVPHLERRRGAWPVKRAAIGVASALSRALARVPVRRLGVGSADEAYSYFRDIRRCADADRWEAADGYDYEEGLARVTCPVLLVLSEGDRVVSPATATRLWSRLPRSERLDLQGLRPGHMALVTDPRSAPIWRRVAAWLRDQLG